MPTYVDINPKLLRWVVDRSGLPLDEYQPTVAAWLAGEKKPTYNQLESFARRAMVPFGYLFSEQPPDEALPVPDYRTRTDVGVRQPTPNLIETIFEMQRRQDWMREYLLDEGHEELPFVGSAQIGDKVIPLTERMRATLGLTNDWAEHSANWEEALRLLRERIENAGILIFVNGVVGNSTRRKLDPEEFQGFVLIDGVAPLIFVNGADYKVAQMFTIAHELAHVWVGQSALFELTATTPSNHKVEKYCNAVAAEFLVPADKLKAAWEQTSGGDAAFTSLAKRFKVSPIVVARRAKDRKLISSDDFFSFYNRYMQRERRQQEDRRSGGDFWRTQNVRLGRRFGAAVLSAAEEGRISYTDAYDLTRLYGETFDKYARHLRHKDRG
ncbi:MAG: ImmA/IrrE family metallo-endopeptidase [Pirellulaceae bacterium]